jgi:zinc/manganese transport system permease protein
MIAGVLDGLRAMFALDFMSRAFLAGTFAALAAGATGHYVVLRNQVFAGDALSHVAFTGALAALAFGVDPRAGLFASTIAVALGIGALGDRAADRDVVVGTVFAWVLGLGVLFLSMYTSSRSAGNGGAGVRVLFGSIYGLSQRQANIGAALSGVTVILLLLMARPLLFASVDSDVAVARGLPVRTLGMAFMALLGLTVGAAVQTVGSLLVTGLLVTPAAAAHRLTARPGRALALSAGIGVGCVWGGLTLSYAFPRMPPSFLVVALAFGVYIAAVLGDELRRHRARPSMGDGAGAANL